MKLWFLTVTVYEVLRVSEILLFFLLNQLRSRQTNEKRFVWFVILVKALSVSISVYIREGERKTKLTEETKFIQAAPTRTFCQHRMPLPYFLCQIIRTSQNKTRTCSSCLPIYYVYLETESYGVHF